MPHPLKLIVRNFYSNRAYTGINLMGLTLGFAVLIFSTLYVLCETDFEYFHSRSDRIYRVTYRYTPNDGYVSHWARIPFDYINEIPRDLPGVKNLIRFQNHIRKYVRIGEEKFAPVHAYSTDKEVFNVFDFKLLQGNPQTALSLPHSVVVSRSLATKYFGDKDPMGQEIYVISDVDNTETLHHITGVMEDLPAQTHLPVDLLISFKDASERTGWAYTYIELEEGMNAARVQAAFPDFIKKYTPQEADKDALILQPIRDIHLTSDLAREIVPNGKLFYVRIVGIAGILILVVAVINFMNLFSAMTLGRAREVGVRKILGASRSQIVASILTETIFCNLLAAVIGLGLVYLSMPWVRNISMIAFPLDWSLPLSALLLVALFCGILSGVYPAILLNAIRSTEILKTTKALSVMGKRGPVNLKRMMVTLQFAISIVLLASAFVAYNQLNYINTMNLGLTREQIIAIPGVPDKVKEGLGTFKRMVSAEEGISGVSACMQVPSTEIRDVGRVLVEGVTNDPDKAPVMDIQVIDEDFASLLGLEFLAGRNIQTPAGVVSIPEFTETYTMERYLQDRPREYLINETAMRQLGWQSPQEAIGQKISWQMGDFLKLSPGAILGVVRDFHQESLKNKVDPVIMIYEPVWLRTFLIKVETQNMDRSVEKIAGVWNKLFPQYPMEYHFLSDMYENLYKGDRLQIRLLFILSGLAILIAFIGLVGMVAYSLRTRMKEIAVRQVLGATLRNLIVMMSREYLLVLLVGGFVAVPVSLYAAREWLAGFAYRVDISPVAYILTVGLMAALLVITVAIQTLKASVTNPSEILRDN